MVRTYSGARAMFPIAIAVLAVTGGPVAAQEVAVEAPPADTAPAAMEPAPTAPEPAAEGAPAAPAPAAAPAPERRSVDQEIIITAQKTEQALQDVPISVSAISGELFRDAALGDLNAVSAYVPSVRTDTDDLGSPQVFIRGFGTNTFNPSFEPSVGFVQDELFLARGAYFTEPIYDVKRIEILRGPQGTLFGKNTVAGVYNVITESPGEDVTGDASGTFGSYGERRFEGGVGGMFGDWWGARFSFLDWSRDGRLDNTTIHRTEDELEQRAGRVKLRLLPTDSIDIEIQGSLSDTEIPFWPFQLRNLDADTRDFLDNYDPEVEDDAFDFQTSMNADGFLEKNVDTVGGRVTWNLDGLAGIPELQTVAVVGRSDLEIRQLSDLDVSPVDIAQLKSAEDYDQMSLELRAVGARDGFFEWDDAFSFVGGIFVLQSDYHIRASVNAGTDLSSYLLTADALELATEGAAPGLPLGGLLGGVLPPLDAVIGEDYYRFDFTQDTLTIAPFGQVTWDVGPWSFTPGVRVNWEKKEADSLGQAVCDLKGLLGACVMATLVGGEDYDERGLERDEIDVSPKFTVQYRWGDDLSLYAGWARGFKSGGVNSISFTGDGLEFKPEKAQLFEVGAKGTFLGDTLQLNLALHRTELDDLQVLAFNGVFFDVTNAASATSQGVELDGVYLTPYEPLTLVGSFGFLDATYDDFEGAPAPVGNGINTVQDLSGDDIAFAPDITAAFMPTLEYDVYEDWPLALSFDVLYQGEHYTDTDLDPATRVPANTIFSTRARLATPDQTWSFTIGVKNLTDKKVLNQVSDALFFPGTYYAQQAQARVVYGSVRFAF
jgi:iron complex outermembrane recepter protein